MCNTKVILSRQNYFCLTKVTFVDKSKFFIDCIALICILNRKQPLLKGEEFKGPMSNHDEVAIMYLPLNDVTPTEIRGGLNDKSRYGHPRRGKGCPR